MLVMGKPGTAGVGKGVLPILDGDVVVARLRLRPWRENRDWVFGRRGRELTVRPADAPEDAVRLRARTTNSGHSGRWVRRPTLEADPALSLEAQVFLLWLEYVIRRRSRGAVAGAAVAGPAAAGAG